MRQELPVEMPQAPTPEKLLTIMPIQQAPSPFKTSISSNDVIPSSPVATQPATPAPEVVATPITIMPVNPPGGQPFAPKAPIYGTPEWWAASGSGSATIPTSTVPTPPATQPNVTVSPVEMAGGQAVAAPAAGGMGAVLALGAGGFLVGGPVGAMVGLATGFFLGKKAAP